MLTYKYVHPDREITTCRECKKYHYCIRIMHGHEERILCNEKEIEPKEMVSHNPDQEYFFILRDLWLMKNMTEKTKFQIMIDDFHPQKLRPSTLEGFPASYVECCLYIELIDIFTKYVEENKIELGSNKDKMTHILLTTIVIDNGVVVIFSFNKELKDLFKNKIKEYKEYHISYFETNKVEVKK